MAQELLHQIQETRKVAKEDYEKFSSPLPFVTDIEPSSLEYFLDTEFYEVFYYKGILVLAVISTGTIHPLTLDIDGKYQPGPKIATFTVEPYDSSHHTTNSLIDGTELGIIYSN